jgi:SMC interacting uncharacterized protein involved in chromosome segregation
MTNDLNFQALSILIGAITVIISISILLYNVGRKLGELEGIKQVMNSNLESLNQKYIISEKIQKAELKIQKVEVENQNDRENIKTQISKLQEELMTLKKQIDAGEKKTEKDLSFLADSSMGIEGRLGDLEKKLQD